MERHQSSVKEYGSFVFNANPVIAYGLTSAAGGAATIFSFVDEDDAEAFFETCLLDQGVPVILNTAQVIFLCGYLRACQLFDGSLMIKPHYEKHPMLRLVDAA